VSPISGGMKADANVRCWPRGAVMINRFSAANIGAATRRNIHECEISLRKCVLFDSTPGGRELSGKSVAAGSSCAVTVLRRRQSMLGLMQDRPLLISGLIEYAARYHPDVEIVSRTCEGPVLRTNYAGLRSRAAKLAKALIRLGVKPVIVSQRSPGTHIAIWSCTSRSPGSAPCCTPSIRAVCRADRVHHQSRRKPRAVLRHHVCRSGVEARPSLRPSRSSSR